MKKIIYLILFTILGVLLGFLVHAILEIWYIRLLLSNYERYGLGLTFDTWFTIHTYFSVITFVGGLLFGYFSGKKWWRVLYVEKKFRKWLKKDLKKEF